MASTSLFVHVSIPDPDVCWGQCWSRGKHSSRFWATTKDVASTQGMSLLGLLGRKDISWLKHSTNWGQLKLESRGVAKKPLEVQYKRNALYTKCIGIWSSKFATHPNPSRFVIKDLTFCSHLPGGPRFHLFGPNVEYANRMESTGLPGKVQISHYGPHSVLTFLSVSTLCFGSPLFCENIWEAVSWFTILQIILTWRKTVFFFVIIWSVPFCSWKRLQNYSDGLLAFFLFKSTFHEYVKPR